MEEVVIYDIDDLYMSSRKQLIQLCEDRQIEWNKLEVNEKLVNKLMQDQQERVKFKELVAPLYMYHKGHVDHTLPTYLIIKIIGMVWNELLDESHAVDLSLPLIFKKRERLGMALGLSLISKQLFNVVATFYSSFQLMESGSEMMSHLQRIYCVFKTPARINTSSKALDVAFFMKQPTLHMKYAFHKVDVPISVVNTFLSKLNRQMETIKLPAKCNITSLTPTVANSITTYSGPLDPNVALPKLTKYIHNLYSLPHSLENLSSMLPNIRYLAVDLKHEKGLWLGVIELLAHLHTVEDCQDYQPINHTDTSLPIYKFTNPTFSTFAIRFYLKDRDSSYILRDTRSMFTKSSFTYSKEQWKYRKWYIKVQYKYVIPQV
ncbi:hypothetical protein DFA_11396 [Cavenderia fasciculata]|uniref:Uncharacterized protein n=1 Tax=Cavenderia fasciculata TaxID=261658 RepID=F4QCQ3_CACFS|nr:uncharacterized protein DFA_11396 [Cavenderia fasciculata]EGG13635.1 hypothetical protein DFA_11396 [Cavenderia fasciculata]|eukprot:XP_004350339.1 hypothetical protein DFA_11396 [Cavenderia fasciculata]